MPGSSQCPGGYAVGIRGRDGGYVTAFGLMCGPKPSASADPNAGHTLGKRKRPNRPAFEPGGPRGEATSSTVAGSRASIAGTLDEQRASGGRIEGPAATAPRTLGKRKRPAPASPEPAPAGETISAINSDSFNAPPPESAPAEVEPPSPLINGSYATTLSVTESRCLGQDLRGTWRGTAEIDPQPAISIPLQTMGPLFAAPVTVQVQGLVVRQSTQVRLRSGLLAGAVPADLDGVFSNDGSRFNVRFTAGNGLCRIGGTISGERP